MPIRDRSTPARRIPTRRAAMHPLREFLATERAGGAAIVLGAAIALLWANSPWSASYKTLWATDVGVHLGRYGVELDLRHCVNDGLMSVFFLVVGLEIKRELVQGELRERRKALTPVGAAVGGMVVPALLFVGVTLGTPEVRGWGVPMATDIAIAVGVLALAGPRFPAGARLFLLALAIVDDIGAIAVIAVFYRTGGRSWLLGLAAVIVAVVVLARRTGVASIGLAVALGAALWWTLREAGVHPTLAGVAMGLLAPTEPSPTRPSASVVERLERRLHPWTSFVVVPVFAVANAGIELSGDSLRGAVHAPVAWGVGLGLMIGKPIGILVATYAMVRFGLGALPDGTRWPHLAAVGIVAGAGFTVSLFVTELAFEAPAAAQAKIAVLVSSLAAAIVGLAVARVTGQRETQASGSSR